MELVEGYDRGRAIRDVNDERMNNRNEGNNNNKAEKGKKIC
jgi:hypothetical protein